MRFYLALLAAKISRNLFISFNIGAGGTWPGHLALKIYPEILRDKRVSFKKGLILITGTNGKTTTSKIITHLLQKQGQKVVNNATGANLINGIVSEVLDAFSFNAKFLGDYGVFEVDEFVLPRILDFFNPDLLLLLNLSRDQLDRYGETDIIFERWLKALKDKPNIKIVYDAETKVFSVSNDSLSLANMPNTSTFDSNEGLAEQTKLKGSFNVKNLNAALKALELFGYLPDVLLSNLEDFDFAYGRGEQLGKFYLYLAKNPASFNHNLKVLDDFSFDTALLLVLNDNIPDGRDVSWIYDINTDLLHKKLKRFKNIFVSGSRAYDLAVRLKYAGIALPEENISTNLSAQINNLERNPAYSEVVILPNYSAMLETRKFLTGKAIL